MVLGLLERFMDGEGVISLNGAKEPITAYWVQNQSISRILGS
jgi:hypothetical protein